ncbi:UNVERIFIED_CONTAM: hypothetical protein HDU68_004417, partial [Siphonaria sp. JEL0065]
GQDGKKYSHGESEPYGPKFKQGDVIGCGFDWDSRSVFFTLNGRNLGIAFMNIETKGSLALYPAIGLHDPSEVVAVNLGDKPFRFNLDEFVESEKQKTLLEIEVVDVPPPHVHALIQEYLLHSGYKETLLAFHPETNSKKASVIPQIHNGDILEKSLVIRNDIQQEILAGNIFAAKSKLVSHFPSLFAPLDSESTRLLDLFFKCQEFIETCRRRTPIALHPVSEDESVVVGKFNKKRKGSDSGYSATPSKKLRASLDEQPQQFTTNPDIQQEQDWDALMAEFLHSELGPLNEYYSQEARAESASVLNLLEIVAGLAAYENPFTCPQKHLLHKDNRRNLADAVNVAILDQWTQGTPTLLVSLQASYTLHYTPRSSTEQFIMLLLANSAVPWKIGEKVTPILAESNLFRLVAYSYAKVEDLKMLEGVGAEKEALVKRLKAGVLVSLLFHSRKKIKSFADGALNLIDTILDIEKDETILTLAHIIKPFLADSNPGISFDIPISPSLAKAVDDVKDLLSKHDINFCPTFYRYLSPSVSNELLKTRIAKSDFRVQNTWILEEPLESSSSPPPDILSTVKIMNYSNKAVFGPQLSFKAGEDLESLLKAREARRRVWKDYDVMRVTPASATFPPTLTTPTSTTLPHHSTAMTPTSSTLPTASAAASSAAATLAQGGAAKRPVPVKRPSTTLKPRGGAALHQTKKIMMLDDSFVQNEEKAKFEEKKKQEDAIAAEAARKRKEAEDKKWAVQHAKEQKEKELLEKKLQRERTIEERKQRELEEKAKREEERIQREESRRLREEEDRLREERRKQPQVSPVKADLPPIPASTPVSVLNVPSADSVLGADSGNVTEDDRKLVQTFLSGHYDKSTPNREIKLNEAIVTDPSTGVTQVHTMFLVLDYEAAKWRKVKRKRKI